MIKIEYQPDIKDLAKATITYIENNLVIKTAIIAMNISCWMVCLAYTLKFATSTLVTSDGYAVVFALLWIIFRRIINEKALLFILKKKKINQYTNKINIGKKRISWINTANHMKHLLWKNLQVIYKTKKGYIIPKVLDAPLNSTFIWIPKSSFNDKNTESEFLDIIKLNNIKLKNKKIS